MLYVRVNDGKKDIHHCIIPGGRNEILSKLIICRTRVCYKGRVILPNEHEIPSLHWARKRLFCVRIVYLKTIIKGVFLVKERFIHAVVIVCLWPLSILINRVNEIYFFF